MLAIPPNTSSTLDLEHKSSNYCQFGGCHDPVKTTYIFRIQDSAKKKHFGLYWDTEPFGKIPVMPPVSLYWDTEPFGKIPVRPPVSLYWDTEPFGQNAGYWIYHLWPTAAHDPWKY